MKRTLLLVTCLASLSASAFTLGDLWIDKSDSFAQGACDDQRGWFALTCWTAEIDIVLEPGESGTFVLEYCTDIASPVWHELNNNPDIAFPPFSSFNGQIVLPSSATKATWSFVYPSPPLETMFLRLKKL
jgi:hypothetical protein